MKDVRVNLKAIMDSYSRTLSQAFEDTEKALGYPFDRGTGREEALKAFLAEHLPKRYGIGTGFVINSRGDESKQLDIVIYDANVCPVFAVDKQHNAYPIEGVFAAIEVKSTLNEETMFQAWDNAYQFKQVVYGAILDKRQAPLRNAVKCRVPRLYAVFAYRAEDFSGDFSRRRGVEWHRNAIGLLEETVFGIGFDCVYVHDQGIVLPIMLNPPGGAKFAIKFHDPKLKHHFVTSKDFTPFTFFFLPLLQVLNSIDAIPPDISPYNSVLAAHAKAAKARIQKKP